MQQLVGCNSAAVTQVTLLGITKKLRLMLTVIMYLSMTTRDKRVCMIKLCIGTAQLIEDYGSAMRAKPDQLR